MQDGNRFSHHYGKIQLLARLDLLLLALRDIRSDGLCGSLTAFVLLPDQPVLYLLAAVFERRVGAHHGQHARTPESSGCARYRVLTSTGNWPS